MSEAPKTTVVHAKAAIRRAYCAHLDSDGMGYPALRVREAIAEYVEHCEATPAEQAERMREWARILITAADVLERADA